MPKRHEVRLVCSTAGCGWAANRTATPSSRTPLHSRSNEPGPSARWCSVALASPLCFVAIIGYSLAPREKLLFLSFSFESRFADSDHPTALIRNDAVAKYIPPVAASLRPSSTAHHFDATAIFNDLSHRLSLPPPTIVPSPSTHRSVLASPAAPAAEALFSSSAGRIEADGDAVGADKHGDDVHAVEVDTSFQPEQRPEKPTSAWTMFRRSLAKQVGTKIVLLEM